MNESVIDIAIVGGGPAGLTAALYAARGLATTIVFEKEMFGGQITKTDWIENYPGFPEGISGFDLSDLFAKQAETHGAELRAMVSVDALELRKDGLFALRVEGEELLAKSVIIATGSKPRSLGVTGEDMYTGRGVSWCATCDAAFFRNKRVAVIGGGNAALEEALFLTKFADEVHIVHRREGFRAAGVLVERTKSNGKISFHLNQTISEIKGENDKVTGIELHSTQDQSKTLLPVDGVFIFVGTNPTNDLIADMIKTDERGYIPTGSSGETSVAGLFVAGDITSNPLKQVVTAAGEGALAGEAALRYLEELVESPK